MTKNILFLSALFFTLKGFSQQTIADARRTLGETVTVSGIVTNGGEFGVIRYFQDSTAGLAAYSDLTADLNRGDSITVTGSLKDYNNLLEMDPVESVTMHSTGNSLPSPKIISVDEIGEDYESQLVRIDNVQFAHNIHTATTM